MTYNIPLNLIKPGQVINFNSDVATLNQESSFLLKHSDNGILIKLYAAENDVVRIHPGDSVLACGEKVIPMMQGEEKLIYLESGPYVTHNSDGTCAVTMSGNEDGDTEVFVIQLI